MASPNHDNIENRNSFLAEQLRYSYDRQWALKESIEKKALDAIKTCGIIFAILFGFLDFTNYQMSEITRNLLITGILLSIICIGNGFVVVGIKRLTPVFNNMDVVDTLRDSDNDIVTECVISSYQDGIRKIVKRNNFIARFALYAQIFMMGSILVLMSAIILLIFNIKIPPNNLG